MISGLGGLLVLLVAAADILALRGPLGRLEGAGLVVLGATGSFALGYELVGIVGWAVALTAIAAGWVWLGRSDGTRPRHIGLLAMAVVLVSLAGFESVIDERWATSLALVAGDRSAAETISVVGVLLLMLATGNRVARLAIAAVGATPQPESQSRARSGRVIGALERLLLVLLMIAGNGAAVAGVVAAKGILRYPEIQRGSSDGEAHGGHLAEYVLVGTLASVLVALVGALLVS